MIQASELRLGNKINHNGIVCTVLGIDSNSWLQLDNEQLNTRCDDCEYIHLTEEWLLKAGAQVYKFDHKQSEYRIGNRLIVIRDGYFFDYGTSLKLEFVHRFQNLFFELQYGKELEFKL